jgi:hypothetical protein
MKKTLSLLAAIGLTGLIACSQPEPAAPTMTPMSPAAAPASAPGEIQMTALPEFTAGPYTVLPKYEDALADGHINLYITGGEVAAVRIWVGDEDPAGSLVVKSEIENDYHHGHLEMPNPIPPGARLWAEIETPTGESVKGSTPLQ